MRILESDTIKQAEIKQKTTTIWNDNALGPEFHEKDKHLGCLPRQILKAILEMDWDKWDQKTNDKVQSLAPDNETERPWVKKKEEEDSSAKMTAWINKYNDKKTTYRRKKKDK